MQSARVTPGRGTDRGGLSEMRPEGAKSQGQPIDSGEPILARIERDHRQIVYFHYL